MKIAFEEIQKFTQWWLWLILFGVSVFPILGLYKQLIVGEKFGDKPMSNSGLVLFSLVVFSVLILFWLMRLKTEIDQDEIRINFSPFVKKRVKWHEVKSAQVLNYGFVGWGIRFWTKYGTVYNTKGNKGLAIELLNGKKFLIGTQKEAELKRVVETLFLK